MKKQMAVYEKQLPNLFQFFNYLEKEARIVKQNKKQKTKDIVLSYEELDFLKNLAFLVNTDYKSIFFHLCKN